MPREVTAARIEELELELAEYKEKHNQALLAQRRLSAAYVRLRTLIGPEAFDTPYAPTGKQVWDVTEAALRKRLGEGDRAAEEAFDAKDRLSRYQYPDNTGQ